MLEQYSIKIQWWTLETQQQFREEQKSERPDGLILYLEIAFESFLWFFIGEKSSEKGPKVMGIENFFNKESVNSYV